MDDDFYMEPGGEEEPVRADSASGSNTLKAGAGAIVARRAFLEDVPETEILLQSRSYLNPAEAPAGSSIESG
jgi:hypothetical protein